MSTQITQSFGTTEVFLRTLIAGGVAGCCAKSTVAPFDRVKILLQGHHHNYRHLGVMSILSSVVTREGVTGLYRGNTAQMLRIFPYAATQFACYEHSRKYLMTIFGEKHWTHLLAGSFAGMIAVAVTYPLDVIRTRLAFHVSAPKLTTAALHSDVIAASDGIAGTARSIISHEGSVKALYRGLVPTMIGMAPYAGISFYSYATIKDFASTYMREYACTCDCPPGEHNENSCNSRLKVSVKLLCGGLSGAIAQTIAYPLDVTRRRMQLHELLPESQRFSTWYGTLHRLALDHGVKHGLYRGLSLNYLKVTPTVAVSFSVYELMKEHLGIK